MANQTDTHTAAKASGVPSVIEFVPDDALSHDADEDCDLLDIDFDHDAHDAHDAPDAPDAHEAPEAEDSSKDAAVTRQELDDMKKMIRDMRRNPELLHQSPVYSKTVHQGSAAIQPSRRREHPYDAANSRAAPLFQSMGSASTPYSSAPTFPSSSPTTQKSYCQECNSSSAPANIIQGHVNLDDLPPPPFR